ncbi:TetR/AcrR family transcriptional regulator [Streptomyces chartreusis]|uniref:TetR/AcrR family transcriptional regulator n=1 Tax=Streptomyces chartreusis TaxID=1969 RepID=UPI002E8134A4|nr:TetR/AcrR family transcriptional regulator [Streptomyces chartreusis]WUB22793.1 TetR/AcrR family transcriptional regulator [Streptomyces chartreusis]
MSTPARRQDAVENRNRIVEAARAALAESDRVHLNEIAKRAGVGQGTLYRNFPNREALLAEVYRRDVEELVTAASALLEEHEHAPVEALRLWLDRVVDYAEIKRGVLAALEPAASQDLVAHSHSPIEGALGELLDAGQAAGSLRADVDAHGVLVLVACLSRLDRDEWESTARPLMNVILDGLRLQPRPDAPAAVTPPSGATDLSRKNRR